MDNKLQLEINRAKEIMKLPLLNEGIPGATSDFFRKFFKTTTKADEVLTPLASKLNMDSRVVDDFIDVLNDSNAYEALSAVRKRNLFRLLSDVDGLSDELFEGVMDAFDSNLDELNDSIYKLMNGEEKLTHLQAINRLFRDTPEVIPLIRKKQMPGFNDYERSRSAAGASTDAAKGADEVAQGADEVSGIVNDIDETPLTIDEVLDYMDEILNPDTWEEEVQNLTDTMAGDLAKQNRFKAAFQKIGEWFTVSQRQKQEIENLAQSLSNTNINSDTKIEIAQKLQKKLEKTYYTSVKSFRQLRKYFDIEATKDANFNSYWKDIKKDEFNDIAFWKTFAKKVPTKSAWSRSINGLTDNFKSIFALERKIGQGIRWAYNKLNKSATTPKKVKDEFKNQLGNLFKSGTRRGFPKLTNENYTKLIQSKGPVAAKVVYLRDLGANYLRYSVYVSLLEFGRNILADKMYSQQILECALSQSGATSNTVTEQENNAKTTDPCAGLTDNWWDKFFVDWALQRRPNLEQTLSDGWKTELSKIFYNNFKPWKSTTGPSDAWYWALLENDPGFIGETLNIAASFISWIDYQLDKSRNIDSADELRQSLSDLLEKTKVTLKETGDKIVDETNEVVDDMEEKLDEFTDEKYNNASTQDKERYLLAFPGLKDATGQYWDQLKRKDGIWIFDRVEDNIDYPMFKGDDLKDKKSEFPFDRDESEILDDEWYILNVLGGGKYAPWKFKGEFIQEMKNMKGLAILLEQGSFPGETGSSETGSSETGSSETGGSETGGGTSRTSRASRTDDREKKEEYENRMLAMFEKFNIEDRDSARNLVDKLTTRDKEAIVKDCFDALIAKYDGISNISKEDEKYIDDTVVSNTVLYLINDRKMDPFKILYKSPLELDAKLMESVGLERILLEQAATVSYNTIYINYLNGAANDDKFELIKGAKAERTALDNYNKRTGQSNYEETPTPSPTPRPEEQNEQRPEEAMKIDTPKMMKKHMNNEKS